MHFQSFLALNGFNFSLRKFIFASSVRRYVQSKIEQDSRGDRPMTFTQVTLCAIDRDNQLWSEKDHVNTVSTPQAGSSSNQRNNKRKSPEKNKSDVVCYHCNKKGHRFGTLANPICPEKASPRTINYFKKTNGISSSSNTGASGSGESKS